MSDHKKLKQFAALHGKSMKDIVIELIGLLDTVGEPNSKTVSAIKKVDKGQDLVTAENAKDLFEKLGI